jgi:hypothetical protein
LVVDAALHLGHHLDVMEPNALFDSLKIVAERCGDHRDTVAIVKILAVRHLGRISAPSLGRDRWGRNDVSLLGSQYAVQVFTAFWSPEQAAGYRYSPCMLW